MLRCAVLVVSLLLSPIAHAVDFDDGMTHEVDSFIGGITFISDSVGGAPTTVNLISGGEFGTVNIHDSSVLNTFAGSEVFEFNYLDTSLGSICGGTMRALDLDGSPSVEVNGGTFSQVASVTRVFDGALVVQGGTFETTGQAYAIVVGAGTMEFRGGAIIDGKISAGGDSAVTISGGSLGSEGIDATTTSTVTIIGQAFNLSFGLVPHQGNGFVIETLTGTLADGSPVNIPLFGTADADFILVEGTQGSLSSAVCGQISGAPLPVPVLSRWWGASLALALLLVIGKSGGPGVHVQPRGGARAS